MFLTFYQYKDKETKHFYLKTKLRIKIKLALKETKPGGPT